MKKHFGRLFILLIALMMAMPAAVFATTPPTANTTRGTLSVEYRYMAGQEPNIPQEITRFGFRYYLVSQSDPVLESTLPAVRTYSYGINGKLTAAQLAEAEDELGLTATITAKPVPMMLQIEMDQEVPLPGRDTNDVSDLPTGAQFFDPDSVRAYIFEYSLVSGLTAENEISDVILPAPPLTDELRGRTITKNPEITGVEFVALKADDGYPLGYDATVVYRGFVQFNVTGFTEVEITYASGEYSEVDVYIVTAEYESDALPPPIEVVSIGDGGVPLGGGLTQAEQALVNAQSGNLLQDIADGYVPLGNAGVTGTWSLLSMILAIAAVAIAAIYLIGMFARRKREEVIKEYGEDSERLKVIEKRAVLLRTLTIIVGAMTIVMWLYTDDLSLGVTWINMFTQIAAVLCGATVVLLVFTKMQNNKVKQFIKNMFAGESSVA